MTTLIFTLEVEFSDEAQKAFKAQIAERIAQALMHEAQTWGIAAEEAEGYVVGVRVGDEDGRFLASA